jgi:hypothetical protein
MVRRKRFPQPGDELMQPIIPPEDLMRYYRKSMWQGEIISGILLLVAVIIIALVLGLM